MYRAGTHHLRPGRIARGNHGRQLRGRFPIPTGPRSALIITEIDQRPGFHPVATDMKTLDPCWLLLNFFQLTDGFLTGNGTHNQPTRVELSHSGWQQLPTGACLVNHLWRRPFLAMAVTPYHAQAVAMVAMSLHGHDQPTVARRGRHWMRKLMFITGKHILTLITRLNQRYHLDWLAHAGGKPKQPPHRLALLHSG